MLLAWVHGAVLLAAQVEDYQAIVEKGSSMWYLRQVVRKVQSKVFHVSVEEDGQVVPLCQVAARVPRAFGVMQVTLADLEVALGTTGEMVESVS